MGACLSKSSAAAEPKEKSAGGEFIDVLGCSDAVVISAAAAACVMTCVGWHILCHRTIDSSGVFS